MTLCLPQPHISIMWIPVSGYTTAPLFLTIRYRVSSFPCVTKCQKKWRRFATLKIIRAQNTLYNTIAGKEKKIPIHVSDKWRKSRKLKTTSGTYAITTEINNFTFVLLFSIFRCEQQPQRQNIVFFLFWIHDWSSVERFVTMFAWLTSKIVKVITFNQFITNFVDFVFVKYTFQLEWVSVEKLTVKLIFL